ncbi:MAG: 30S ribosomal protein S3 [Candidatus Dojkabacteria bacterium]|nr:30S ribosomal protein S3 [Candidatus Dojkabacteria bacterium]
MGQKINPRGFRIAINKNWRSVWYMPKEKYGDMVYDDYRIRKFVKKELRAAGVERVIIKRYVSKIEIEIRVARPGVVIGRGGEQIEKIKESLNKMLKAKVELKVVEVKDPDSSAQLIADRIAEQLERRIVPKFIMSKEQEKAVSAGKIKGLRIWVSGRIKGAEIARTEKTEWGTIPLQTLKAKLDYATSEAQVPNAGKQGVKVWIYKGKGVDED